MKKFYLLIIVLSCWFGNNSLQAQCSVNISTNPNTTQLNCADTVITLKANATGSGSITYQWSTGETKASVKVKNPGNYSVTITAGGGCTSSSSINITKDVTTPDVSILAFPDTICSGNSSTLVAIGADSYKWTPGNLTGAVITVSPAAATNYIVTGTASNGCQGKDSFNMVVNSLPAASISGNSSVCQNAAEPPITFKGSKGTQPYTFMYNINNGSTQAITTSGNNTSVTIGLSTGTTGLFSYNLISVADANGCTQAQSGTSSIKVLPAPFLTSAKTASICDGTKFTYTAISSAAGTNFTWVRLPNSHITPAPNSNANTTNLINETLNNNTTDTALVNYIFTLSTGTGCITTDTLTLTVNPTPKINPVHDYTFCNGSLAVSDSFKSGSPNAAFTWKNNNPGIGLAATGSGNILPFIASNNSSDTTAGTVTVKITASSDNCPGPDSKFTIYVLPAPVLTSAKTASICDGDKFKDTAISSATGTNFTWVRLPDPRITPAPGPDSNRTNLINETLHNITNTPVVVNYVFILSTGTGCITTDTLKLTVNPTPKINPVHDYTFCNGSLTIIDSFESSSPNAAFTWKNNNPNIGLANSGSGNILPFIAKNSSSDSIKATITVRATASIDNCPGPDITFTIYVLPAPVLTSAKTASICDNTIFKDSAISSATGTNFTWVRLPDSRITPAPGPDSNRTNLINETLHNTTNAPVTVNYIFILSTGTSCITTDTVKLTVNPTPKINPVHDYTFCSGSLAIPDSFESSSPNAAFIWSNNNPNIGLDSNGSGNILPFITKNNTPDTIAGIVTVKITASSDNCPGPDTAFTIYVPPTPILTSAKTASICDNTVFKDSAISSATGTKYTWIRLPDSSITPAPGPDSNRTNLINETLHNTTNAPVTVNYIFILSTGTDCITIDTLKLTVNPTPVIDSPVSNYFFCNGDVRDIPIVSHTQQASITWGLTNKVSIGLPENGTDNIPLFTATNIDDTPIVANLIANIKIGNNGECEGNPDSFNITVYPTAKLVNSTDTSICDNFSFNYAAKSSATGTIFNWRRDLVTGITNPAQKDTATNVINETLDNNQISKKPVYYYFTLFTDSAKSCSYKDTLKVIVNPTPKLTHRSDTLFCNNELVKAIDFTGTPLDAAFTWTNDNINIGLAKSGIGDITGFIATNTSDKAITGNIKVDITYSSLQCPGPPDSFKITVNPSAAKPYFISLVSYNDTLKLCNGSNNISFNINAPVTGTDYKWTSSEADTNIVHIKDSLYANTVISFLKLKPGDFYKITARAINTVNGGCDDTISQVVKLLETGGIVERTIFKKQPGNLLIYPDNSLTTYQWGYDSVINMNKKIFSPSAPIAGQVYQFFIPDIKFLKGEELNETDYLYWVALTSGNCYTKVYYNGPYVGDNLQAVPLPGGAPQLRVIPNPNNGVFEIVLSGNIYGNINAKIYNATGKAVYVKSFSKFTQSVNEKFVTGNLASGFYFIELYSSDLKKVVSRFLIQR